MLCMKTCHLHPLSVTILLRHFPDVIALQTTLKNRCRLNSDWLAASIVTWFSWRKRRKRVCVKPVDVWMSLSVPTLTGRLLFRFASRIVVTGRDDQPMRMMPAATADTVKQHLQEQDNLNQLGEQGDTPFSETSQAGNGRPKLSPGSAVADNPCL